MFPLNTVSTIADFAAASAASAQALAEAELAASQAQEAASAAAALAAATSVASQAVQDASEMAAVTPPAVEPVAKPAKESKEIKEIKEAKKPAKAEPSSDEAWVSQLPATAYVVQLVAMDTKEEMRSFQRSNAVYAKARIMQAKHKDNGKTYFILVAGPFETKAQADAFMQSSPLLAKGWLRSSKSMKNQYNKS